MSERNLRFRARNLQGMKNGAQPTGAHHRSYKTLTFKEKPTKSKHRGHMILNMASLASMKGKLYTSMNPYYANGKVREMRDMTPEEIEAIKQRYEGGK